MRERISRPGLRPGYEQATEQVSSEPHHSPSDLRETPGTLEGYSEPSPIV